MMRNRIVALFNVWANIFGTRVANEPIRVEFWTNRIESQLNFIKLGLEFELDEFLM